MGRIRTVKPISIDRIRVIDAIGERELRLFICLGDAYGAPPPFFLRDEHVDKIDLINLSMKWNVPLEEFFTYVAVQRYIHAYIRETTGDIPLPEDIADRLDIPADEFLKYIKEKKEELLQAHTAKHAEDNWREGIQDELQDIHDSIAEEQDAQ
ncbi:MAG TPA: hypothetical protein PKZ12_02910 [Smithellaceae bacterium]|nr:hypothetical protein [Smithellaceae bacterium]